MPTNEAPVTQLAAYNPTPQIRVDEQDLARVSDLIISMDVREREGGLATLELRLSNIASDPQGSADFAFENEADLKLGSRITAYSGETTAPQEVFRGVVTGLEADFPEDRPPEITVLAEDTLQVMRMARRTLLHDNVSLADIAENMASTHGLTPAINGFSDNVGTWMQLNESDLAFLRRLLRRYDGDVQIVGDELQVSARQQVQRNELELLLLSQLCSAKFLVDLSQQTTGVSVAGWNPVTGQRVSATSEGRRPGPGDGRTGAEILRNSIGDRVEHIGHIAVASDTEATALANTIFDQNARSFVRVDAKCEGNPRLRVGSHVALGGISPRFDNTYYVTEACHHFDVMSGFETKFCAESFALGNAS